jgi:hypothetical protein
MKIKTRLSPYILLFILLILFIPHSIVNAADEDSEIIWDVTLTIKETGGVQDAIIFGEAINAIDEISPDSHDLPKPPPPIPPAIHSYFIVQFEPPYNYLLQDFRKNTKSQQIWNVSIHWIPQDSNTSTNITISWNTRDFNKSHYSSIKLYKNDNNLALTNMLEEESYTFTASANKPHLFHIKCSEIIPHQNSTPFPPIIDFIILILFLTYVIHRKK